MRIALDASWSHSSQEVAPQRLCAATRELAARALAGEFGRSMTSAGPRFTPEQIAGLTVNQIYVKALRMLATEAPIRIVPGERIIGAATIVQATRHQMPLSPFSSTSHTTPGLIADSTWAIGGCASRCGHGWVSSV